MDGDTGTTGVSDSVIAGLTQRTRLLECALEQDRRARRRRRIIGSALAGCATTLAFVVGWSSSPRAAGPTTVTAPFSVVDDSGRLVMKVDTENGAAAPASAPATAPATAASAAPAAPGASPFVESTHQRNESALLRGFK